MCVHLFFNPNLTEILLSQFGKLEKKERKAEKGASISTAPDE